MKRTKSKTAAAFLAVLLTGVFGFACDSPAENAKEERIEDAGEAQGMSEDKAESLGEAATDSTVTDTTLTGTETVVPIGTDTTTVGTTTTTTTTTTP
jgi:hypothetical protein